jgi:hypothetical protein
MNVGSKLTNWVRNNITGSDENSSYSGKAAQTPVDAEYGRIQDKVDSVGKKLDSLEEDTQLSNTSLRNFKDSELVIGGAAVGGVVGGAAGILSSTSTSAFAKPEVVMHEKTTDVSNQVWKGVIRLPQVEVSKDVPVYNNNGQQIGSTKEVTGYRVDFKPDLESKHVGSYTERTHEIKGQGSGSPLVSGLVGMGTGMAVGAAVGGLVAVGRKAVGMDYDNHERVKVHKEGQKLIQCGILGAAIGGVAGGINGWIESGNAINTHYNTEAPVTQHVTLGQLPQGYTKDALNPNAPPPQGTVPYEVDQYKTKFSLGSNKLDVTEKRVDVNQAGRFGLVGGVVGGMAVGALGGVFAGVAINVIRRAV